MCAVQAQEYRLMRWAVCMRTKKPSAKVFKEAFDSGRILRLHLMRGTWQLIAGEDYCWMCDLFSDKARKVIYGWMHANGIDISEEEHARIGTILADAAAGAVSVTKEDFALALEDNGIVMDDHRLSYHIRLAEFERLLCSGDLLPMKASYSLASRKVSGCVTPSREEALSRIADRYFRSRTPATLEDFVRWTGLGVNDCKKAVASLGDRIHRETTDGREFLFHEESRTGRRQKGSFLLLPSYDEYLLSYKSRDLVLPGRHRHLAHNNSGNFNPITAGDGIVNGNWSPFGKEPGIRYFEEGSGADSDTVEKEWNRYIRFRDGR